MKRLSRKRDLVAAGAQGIGLAISQHLLRAERDVFVFYRRSFHATHSAPESAAAAPIAGTPLGRAGHREQIARTVFLASEYDRSITDTPMNINGGVYAA